jgi:hypothetical protein
MVVIDLEIIRQLQGRSILGRSCSAVYHCLGREALSLCVFRSRNDFLNSIFLSKQYTRLLATALWMLNSKVMVE